MATFFYPHPQWPLSSIRTVVVVDRFNCKIDSKWNKITCMITVFTYCHICPGFVHFSTLKQHQKKTIIKRNVTCDETCSSTLQQSPVIRALKRFLALVQVWVSWTLMNCFHCFPHTLLEKLFYLISEKLQEHFRTTKGFPILLRGRITQLKQSGQLLNEIAVTISVIYRFSQG